MNSFRVVIGRKPQGCINLASIAIDKEGFVLIVNFEELATTANMLTLLVKNVISLISSLQSTKL